MSECHRERGKREKNGEKRETENRHTCDYRQYRTMDHSCRLTRGRAETKTNRTVNVVANPLREETQLLCCLCCLLFGVCCVVWCLLCCLLFVVCCLFCLLFGQNCLRFFLFLLRRWFTRIRGQFERESGMRRRHSVGVSDCESNQDR